MNGMRFTERAQTVLQAAIEVAREHSAAELHPLHLALAILNDSDGLGRRIFEKAGANMQSLERALSRQIVRLPAQNPPPSSVAPGRNFSTMLTNALEQQKKSGDSHVAVDHLLWALSKERQIQEAFKEAGINEDKVHEAIKQVRGNRKVDSEHAESTYDALNKYGKDLVTLAESGKLDPVIGRDAEVGRVVRVLSRRTKNNPVLVGEAGVGKTSIVEGLAQRIVRGDVPNSLRSTRLYSLDLGALVAGASYKGEFEQRLKSVLKEISDANAAGNPIILFIDELHTLVGAGKSEGAMDAANLLKPMLARGELRCIGATTLTEWRQWIEKDPALERRFQMVMVNEPSVEDTVSILRGLKDRYETHHGVRISDAALVTAAQLAERYITHRFQPDKSIDLVDEAASNIRVQLDSRPEVIDNLERRRLQLEVEATALREESDQASKMRLEHVQEELARIREELNSLNARYQEEKGRVDKLRTFRQKLEDAKRTVEDCERRRDLVRAADLKYGVIPELEKKIADLSSNEPKEGNNMLSEVVGPDQIAEVVARWTGIPVKRLTESERERILNLQERLQAEVVGQNEAIEAVAEAVLRSRAGMSRGGRPIGSFLFLGSSGCGKTETAKALARELFDNEKALTRIDMSEYMESHSTARLLGSPPGYVGHEEGGQLTEAVRRRPYSVVLFDEVEKAHRDVVNVLLQVLDDGRLTDGKGRTVDFKNTIIILTSNLGAEFLLKGAALAASQGNAGRLPKEAKDAAMEVVRRNFRPEFLNRLDDIIIFHPLSMQNLQKIVDIHIKNLESRLEEKRIQLRINQQAKDWIIANGFDAAYGARPMQRLLEKRITTALSRLIVAGKLTDSSIVDIGLADGDLTFVVSKQLGSGATSPKIDAYDARKRPGSNLHQSLADAKRPGLSDRDDRNGLDSYQDEEEDEDDVMEE